MSLLNVLTYEEINYMNSALSAVTHISDKLPTEKIWFDITCSRSKSPVLKSLCKELKGLLT